MRGFFSNPNIHPYQEYLRRAATLETYAAKVGLPVIWDRSYPLEEFPAGPRLPGGGPLPLLLLPTPERHGPAAKSGKFDAFTSTLLYSKFQNHDLIRELAQLAVREVGIPFYYEDFRQGWAEGRTKTKSWGSTNNSTAAVSSANETASCNLRPTKPGRATS